MMFVLNAHTATNRYVAAAVVMKRFTCRCMCLLAIVVNSHTVKAVMAVNSIRSDMWFITMPLMSNATKMMPVIARTIRFFTYQRIVCGC